MYFHKNSGIFFIENPNTFMDIQRLSMQPYITNWLVFTPIRQFILSPKKLVVLPQDLNYHFFPLAC